MNALAGETSLVTGASWGMGRAAPMAIDLGAGAWPRAGG
jgi:hypothetical protein